MGFITELKATFYTRGGALVGSTTHVIGAGMNDGLDIVGDGWVRIPMSDSAAVALASVKNRVCVITAKTNIMTAVPILGQFVIKDIDKPRRVTSKSILTSSGPSLLHELTNETFGFNVLSDGNNGPSANPILDLFTLYEVNSPISFSYHSMGVSRSSKAYLVGSGESIFDALLQVVNTNKGHISLANEGYGTFSYPYYGIQFWWNHDGLDGGPPLWFDEFNLNNTASAPPGPPNPIFECIPKGEERDVVTRVYVYGAGLGDGRFTIADKTDSGPTGFTSVVGNSLIINSELEALPDQPIITRTLQVGNIKPEDEENATSVASAANALFASGLQYLEDNDGRKADNYIVKTHIWMNHTCGQAVHLRYVDDHLDVDEDLILVEYKVEATRQGLLVANLLLSPSPTKKVTGGRLIANKLKSLETTMNHATADSSSSTPPTAGGNYLKATGGPPSLAGDLPFNAGVRIDGMDPSEMKIAEYLMFAASSEVNRGRVLQTGDGIDFVDGGVGAYATLQMVLKAVPGLDLDATGLSLLLKTISGFDLDATGISLLLKALSGLNLDATGLSVLLKTVSGLDIDAGGLGLALKSLSGLDLDATGLSLGTPAGLSISSINSVTAVTHSHAITASSSPGASESLLKSTVAGGLTLEDLVINGEAGVGKLTASQVGSHLIPDLTDTYDLGSSTKLWRKGWISELESVLFVQNSVSIIGGWFVIPKASGTLAADVDGVQTTVDFGQAMTLNDFVLLRTSGAVEYLKVGSLVSGTTYNVTRNVDGSGANSWPSGQVYMVLGNTGNGRIEFNAQDTPRISILEQGATYNAQTELVRLGDLDGNWGYSGTKHGLALGQYAVDKANMTWDPTNGLRLRTYNNTVLQLDNAGNASIEGEINIGDDGGIYQGSGTFANPTTGLKLWNESGVGLIAGYNAGVKQWYGKTDGKFYFAGGKIAIGADGVELLGAETGLGRIEFDADYWDGQFSEILRISHKVNPIASAIKHSEMILETEAFPLSIYDNLNFRIYSGWKSSGTPLSGFQWRNGGTVLAELGRDSTLNVYGDIRAAKGIAVGYTGANPNDDAIEFYSGSTRVGDIGTLSTTWLRINQNTAKNIYTPRYFRAEQGLVAGYAGGSPGTGNVAYSGNLRPYRNSTQYTGRVYVQNTTVNDIRPNKYTAGEKYITIRGVGGVPSAAVGAYVTVLFKPATNGTHLRLWSYTGSSWTSIDFNHQNQTGYWRSVKGVCFFDGSGRIRVSISHTLSVDVNIYVSAYLV